MGVSDASVPYKKNNNFTPANQHYITFDSLKMLSNENFSKNLKEVLLANTDKKNNPKLKLINSNNCFNVANIINKKNNNNNLIDFQKKKISYLKNNNVSRTVDKKLTNNNINKSNIYSDSNNKNNSSNKNNYSYLRENSSKNCKSKDKTIHHINNINIHNNSSKEVIPFYYKPKRILTQKASKTNKEDKNNINGIKFKKDNKMVKTKSKENLNSKNLNKINNTPGIDIHRSFNNISRVSSNDKFNIINKSYIKKKVNYKIEYLTDLHNYYNDNINKPLYLLDDTNNYFNNKKKEVKFSNENDFNNIIRHIKDKSNELKICMELLKLKERKWQEEMISINKLIANNRIPKNKGNNININYILHRIVILYDHFNWIIKSISNIYNAIIYENQNVILNNLGLGNLNLPAFNSNTWFKGFKWKGLYIRIDKDINCIKYIKNEIKALNYYFFDYLHIIWDDNKITEDNENNNNILSNNIIFPLIGYSEINSFILIVSSIIKPELNKYINLIETSQQSKGIIELNSKININENNIFGNKIKNNKNLNKYYYKDNAKKYINNLSDNNIIDFNKNKFLKINHSIDFNKKNKNSNKTNSNKKDLSDKANDITYFKDTFYINDLLKSKLFTELSKNNLIKIKGGKYILVNVSKNIPNLFENKFCNNIKKINFFGSVNGQKKYYTLNYNSSFNINIDNIFNININPINSKLEKSSEENPKNNLPKHILEKIYNIVPSPNLKFKNIKIGNMTFRILYYATRKSKISTKKSFVDILYNYIKDIENNKIMTIDKLIEDQNQEIYIIEEPYVIIYDIIEPIKLYYSLIKSIKMKDNQTEVIKNIYFLRTNYIEYFLKSCDMFNKNSYNIKKYQDLKYFMKKYGINQNLLFFSLVKINNKEISDIIQIHLLIKAFRFICFQKDNIDVLNEIKKKQKNNENNQETTINLNENLKSNIIFYIKSILYPNELLPIGHKKFKYIYEQLLFYSNILFFRYKLIDDYLSLGLLNNENNSKNNSIYTFFKIQTPKEFLKHIILIARKKPFLFISEMESKLNFVVDPFVKFKCSISIESMSHQLDIVHINLVNNRIIKTFVKPDEISSLILTKIIKRNKDIDINGENENIQTDFKNNIYKENNKIVKKIQKEKVVNEENNINRVSLNNKPAVLNTKINILSIKNKMNNFKDKDFDDEDKNTNFENENENTYKNDDNKSNISNININTNNNSHIMLRNNSNINVYNNSNDTSNIDINEQATKISNDKIVGDTDMAQNQIYNPLMNLDSNSNNNLPNCKNNPNQNSKNINSKDLRDVYENIIFLLPPICYKILYNYENNKQKQLLFQNLEQFYIIKNIRIILEWTISNESIFKNINNSYDGSCEYTLIKSFIYYFLFVYYVERNRKEALKTNNKLLSLFKNNFSYQLSINDLAIINLLQGLINPNYIDNEEFYSKSVMLLLLNYGDPRGRNNDSHGAMQFPLWEISRKTYKLEEPIINENFKEMYQALDFFDKKKGIFYLVKKKRENMYNFNYMYNIIKNFEKIKLMNIDLTHKKNKNNMEMNDSESIYSMVNNIDENPNENYINKDLTDKDITLNLSIFDKTILEKICIKHYTFPSISCKSPNLGKYFYRKEFVIYIIKEIQSLMIGRGIILNKNFIDKKISEDIIISKETNKNLTNKEKIRDNSNNRFSETPLKVKYNNNFNKEKQLGNSSSKTNSYCEIEKKSNTNYRNTQCLPGNNQMFYTANTSKSYNNSLSSSNEINYSNRNIKKNGNNISSNIKITTRKTVSNNNHYNSHSNKKSKKIFSHFLYKELLEKLSFKKNLPSGIIISFGNNIHNETSHDRYEKLTLPRVIFKLKNEMIKSISSGWQHNLVINNKGEIFSFGHNQEFQCGLPNLDKNNNCSNTENINDPTNISIIHNLRAIKVSCGNEHSLILSKDKNVYGVGNNEDGLLGIPEKNIKSFKPIKINFITKIDDKNKDYNGKISNISCGTVHNLALAEDGNVFSWGSFQGGQLGLSSNLLLSKENIMNQNQELFINKPTIIPFFLKNGIKIEKISCGEAHSLALSDKGKCYSWGFGSNGQLGLGFCEDSFEPGQGLIQSRIFEPQLIKTFKEYNLNNTHSYSSIKINDIECGKTFSMFLSSTNNLYACGINDLNQLGFKDIEPKQILYNPLIQCEDYIYPSLLNCFNNKKVEKISCGEGHCLAIIKDLNNNNEAIWSWGNNKFGQLGHGSIVKISLPKEVIYLTEYNMNKYCEVSCGGFHSLCLLKSKNNLDWIETDYTENILGIIEEIGGLY